MKKCFAILIIILLSLSQPLFAEEDKDEGYNYELANGWRYDNAIAKKSFTAFTTFVGSKNKLGDDALSSWASELIITGEFSFLGAEESMNFSVFSEWGVRWLATGGFEEYTGFDDIMIGAKLQLMKSTMFTTSVFIKGSLPIGAEEVGVGDYVPLGLGVSGSTAFLIPLLEEFIIVGVDFIMDFTMILAKDSADPDYLDFHVAVEGWVLLLDNFMVCRLGFEFDYLSDSDLIDESSWYIYAEAQLGIGIFLRIGVPFTFDDSSFDSFLNNVKAAYETGDLTVTLGYTLYI